MKGLYPQMTAKEMIEVFRILETKFPVAQWQVNGVHVWPLIRLRIGAVCQRKHFGHKEKVHDSLLAKFRWMGRRIRTYTTYYLRDYKHNQEIKSSDIVLFGDSADRIVKMPTGELFDHNLDPIREGLTKRGYKCFEFEQIGTSFFRNLRWSDSYLVDMQVLKAIIKRKIYRKNDTVNEMKEFDEFQLNLIKYKIGAVLLSSVIAHTLLLIDLANWFEDKLKVICPSIIILGPWYGDAQMALTMASKRLRIPVVDVQHGMSAGTGFHIAYSDWTNIPPQGYEVMPNYFWVYSQSDCEAIKSWGKNREKTILGGRPMDLVWRNPVGGSLVHFFQKRYSRLWDSNGRPVILFGLSGRGVEYPEWLIEFINSDTKYIWLIRSHPNVDAYQSDFQSRLVLKGNIFWKEVASFPLEILLQNVDVHLTMISSIILDAALWGCRSVAIHSDVRELYAQQIKDKTLLYVDSPESLSKALDEIVKNKNSKSSETSSLDFYRQGQQGIQRLIDIMKSTKSWEVESF